MPTFRQVFPGKKPVFFIAIHVGLNPENTLRDISVARDGGADGIFLIKDYHTQATDHDVLAAYHQDRHKHALSWTGINLLDHSARDAVNSIDDHTRGLWFDRAYVTENASHLEAVRKWQQIMRPHTLLFPSVAFKYQEPVPTNDYARVVKLAEPYADAIVTSGEGTGIPADFDKVRTMLAASSIPLGLASGVSVENVETYVELGVDFFIVNTSISDNATGQLDPQLVRALRKKIPN